jgi:hypothetical protein
METQNNRDTEAENLGGTINLSPDQLKEEAMTSHTPGQNPDNIENADDLHEIQAGDDLNEPDIEAYQPGKEETNTDDSGQYENAPAGDDAAHPARRKDQPIRMNLTIKPMKKIVSSSIGGFAGAIALNILHQAVKEFDPKAPRVDLVGEEALSKGLRKIGIEAPAGNALFAATLAADLLSNAAYYSLIGCAKKKHLLLTGAASGLVAGIGALTLTEPMGLSDAPFTRTRKTSILTVVWYTFGGLVAGATILALRKK